MGSPAQSILNWRDKLIDLARRIESRDGPVGQRPDTSWHDEMVRQANRGFQQRAAAAQAAVPAAKTPQKRVPKRTPMRPAAGKRR